MASLTGPNAKIKRAVEHLNALEAALNPLVHRDHYTISNNVDLETHEQYWQLDNEPPVIPDIIPLLIGDSLYNFRAALDHLVWQFVLLNGGAPNCRNEFPIFDCSVKYEKGKRSRLEGLSHSAIEIIDGLQPYHPENKALSMLRELSNTDKHRHLHTAVSSALTMHRISVTRRTDGVGDAFLSTSQTKQGAIGHFGPIEKGTKLYSIMNPNVEARVNPQFEFIFTDFQAESRLVVVDVMRSIRDVINKVFVQLSPLFGAEEAKVE